MSKRKQKKKKQTPVARKPATPPSQPTLTPRRPARVAYTPMPSQRRDSLIILALVVSLLLHILFVYSSTHWHVANISEIEEQVENLFKVKLTDLESLNYASRPSQKQLQEERERILEQEIETMAEIDHQSVTDDLVAMAPTPEDLNDPTLRDTQDDIPFVDDQYAKELITSEAGEQTVEQFEESAGDEVFDDDVDLAPIPLTGRSANSETRRKIMANLPEPEIQDDPIVSRSIASLLQTPSNSPQVPEFDVADPPIELPPITELLPSPDLLQSTPESVQLSTEEEAMKEMEERFVQLDDLVHVELTTYHHIGGDGYFQLRIRPKRQDERLPILPKDVILVMDVSASMGRRRIAVLKQEIREILQRLRPEDRFNIVGFKQRVLRFTRTLAPVNEETIDQAGRFLIPLEASGKTDIYSSLEPLVQLGTERARPLIMILFSDGRPTVGVVNSRKIINNLSSFLGPSTSIFCVGTGERLNRYLLDMLAFRNRGLVTFEQDREELPRTVQSLFGYIEDPVLLRIAADFENVDEAEVYPKRLPDLYVKGELNIWGRLGDNDEKITFRLVGEAFNERKEMIFELPVPEFDNGTYEVARNWAYHKAYDLIGKMVQEGERPEYIQTIRAISNEYKIITPYSEQLTD